TTPTDETNNAWFQGYYGARAVWRYNTLNYVWLDVHGNTGTSVGGMWWEVYKNTFTGGTQQACCSLNMRDGSGIVYGNTVGSGTPGDYGFCSEKGGTNPAIYQIGRGTSQALVGAYVFQNDSTSQIGNCAGVNQPSTTLVQENRDIWLSV